MGVLIFFLLCCVSCLLADEAGVELYGGSKLSLAVHSRVDDCIGLMEIWRVDQLLVCELATFGNTVHVSTFTSFAYFIAVNKLSASSAG